MTLGLPGLRIRMNEWAWKKRSISWFFTIIIYLHLSIWRTLFTEVLSYRGDKGMFYIYRSQSCSWHPIMCEQDTFTNSCARQSMMQSGKILIRHVSVYRILISQIIHLQTMHGFAALSNADVGPGHNFVSYIGLAYTVLKWRLLCYIIFKMLKSLFYECIRIYTLVWRCF